MGKTYSTEELVSRWEDQRYMKNPDGQICKLHDFK